MARIVARCVNGHEVLAGDRFCGTCGWAVPAHCHYGHPAQPDDTYCRECGAALHGAALPATAPVTAPTWSPMAQPAWFAEAPGPRPTRRWAAGSTAALVVACLLVLGAAGLGTYAGATGGRGQSSTVSGVSGTIGPAASPHTGARSVAPLTTTAPPPSVTPIAPPSSAPPTTAPPIAPAVPAVSALAGLGPLIGDWKGHGGGVHIGADGQAQATFRAYRLCTDDPTPPCDTMSGTTIVDGGHAQFRLKPTSAPGTASGQVTGSDDPAAFQPGFALTVNLMPGDVMLVTSSPVARSVAYCGPRASAGACGA